MKDSGYKQKKVKKTLLFFTFYLTCFLWRLIAASLQLGQRVLSEPQWKNKLKPEDFRALTPLIYNHVNPYGVFRLDMNSRLVIDQTEASGF